MESTDGDLQCEDDDGVTMIKDQFQRTDHTFQESEPYCSFKAQLDE